MVTRFCAFTLVKQSIKANKEINFFIAVGFSISDCKIKVYVTHYLARLAIELLKLISDGFLAISDKTKKRFGITRTLF
jgi:hypothetical protein